MNIAKHLPSPLNTFVLDVAQNQYYDFGLPTNSAYPLKGVTYSVDYGHILGYTTEDHHELDLFVGNDLDGLCGSITVFRGEDNPDEHKFYVGLSSAERDQVLRELESVLRSHEAIGSMLELIQDIQRFRDKA